MPDADEKVFQSLCDVDEAEVHLVWAQRYGCHKSILAPKPKNETEIIIRVMIDILTGRPFFEALWAIVSSVRRSLRSSGLWGMVRLWREAPGDTKDGPRVRPDIQEK